MTNQGQPPQGPPHPEQAPPPPDQVIPPEAAEVDIGHEHYLEISSLMETDPNAVLDESRPWWRPWDSIIGLGLPKVIDGPTPSLDKAPKTPGGRSLSEYALSSDVLSDDSRRLLDSLPAEAALKGRLGIRDDKLGGARVLAEALAGRLAEANLHPSNPKKVTEAAEIVKQVDQISREVFTAWAIQNSEVFSSATVQELVRAQVGGTFTMVHGIFEVAVRNQSLRAKILDNLANSRPAEAYRGAKRYQKALGAATLTAAGVFGQERFEGAVDFTRDTLEGSGGSLVRGTALVIGGVLLKSIWGPTKRALKEEYDRRQMPKDERSTRFEAAIAETVSAEGYDTESAKAMFKEIFADKQTVALEKDIVVRFRDDPDAFDEESNSVHPDIVKKYVDDAMDEQLKALEKMHNLDPKKVGKRRAARVRSYLKEVFGNINGAGGKAAKAAIEATAPQDDE